MKYIFHGNLGERFLPQDCLSSSFTGEGQPTWGWGLFSPGGQVFFSELSVLPGTQATEGAPCVVIIIFFNLR